MNFLRNDIGEEPVIVEGMVRGSAARIFRAWTMPEEIVKWFGPKVGSVRSAEIDLRVGGRWRFVMEDSETVRASLEGEYLRIEPGRCLAFSWRYLRDYADGRQERTSDSRVTVQFQEENGYTQISLRHEGIVREEGRSGVGMGWNASFRQLAEWLSESALPIDRR